MIDKAEMNRSGVNEYIQGFDKSGVLKQGTKEVGILTKFSKK